MTDVVERPSAQRMPFDTKGVLLPNGPRFPARQSAPDIKGFPYDRRIGEYWTEEEHRTIVFDFIKKTLRDTAQFVTWRVLERRSIPRIGRTQLREPFLRLIFVRGDGTEREVGVSFTDDERFDLTLFSAKLQLALPAILV